MTSNAKRAPILDSPHADWRYRASAARAAITFAAVALAEWGVTWSSTEGKTSLRRRLYQGERAARSFAARLINRARTGGVGLDVALEQRRVGPWRPIARWSTSSEGGPLHCLPPNEGSSPRPCLVTFEELRRRQPALAKAGTDALAAVMAATRMACAEVLVGASEPIFARAGENPPTFRCARHQAGHQEELGAGGDRRCLACDSDADVQPLVVPVTTEGLVVVGADRAVVVHDFLLAFDACSEHGPFPADVRA